MAVAWTDITNGQVAAGAALTTALVTALRDNPEGIAQRASGAPKIFGVPYDYQEFTSSGTWNKPSNAQSGDKVVVQVVAAGGTGQRSTTGQGGAGGAGILHKFEDIDDLGSTETVVVGAAGTGASQDGGDSSFGTVNEGGPDLTSYLFATGGQGGNSGAATPSPARYSRNDGTVANSDKPFAFYGFEGGRGGGPAAGESAGQSSIFGGGGGGFGGNIGSSSQGGLSAYAGRGGFGTPNTGTITDYQINGEFPGGGGGGVDTGVSGAALVGEAGDGVVRVWCYREQA